MALIPASDMNVLIAASAAKAVADSALADLEQQSMAYCINSAANTGEHFTAWDKPISSALLSVLEGQGYTVTRNPNSADPSMSYIIGGF